MSAPEGLSHLVTKDTDGIDARRHKYQTREIVKERFTMTRIQVKRLKALIYWVQDLHRCQESYDFPGVITQQQFLNDVDESLQKHRTRKKATKTGKQMITHKFAVSTQWEIWEHNLQNTLVSIMITNGFPLSFVIR